VVVAAVAEVADAVAVAEKIVFEVVGEIRSW
jgi:hypothetical protein